MLMEGKWNHELYKNVRPTDQQDWSFPELGSIESDAN
jgi:hypothetical protein